MHPPFYHCSLFIFHCSLEKVLPHQEEPFPKPPGNRCPRFFTRSVKQAGALPNAFAVPWRIKRGHGISFIGPGLHFMKCGENRKAVANPRMSGFIIAKPPLFVKRNVNVYTGQNRNHHPPCQNPNFFTINNLTPPSSVSS